MARLGLNLKVEETRRKEEVRAMRSVAVKSVQQKQALKKSFQQALRLGKNLRKKLGLKDVQSGELFNPYGVTFVVDALKGAVVEHRSGQRKQKHESDLPEFVQKLLCVKPEVKGRVEKRTQQRMKQELQQVVAEYNAKNARVLPKLAKEDQELLKKYFGPRATEKDVVQRYLELKESRETQRQVKRQESQLEPETIVKMKMRDAWLNAKLNVPRRAEVKVHWESIVKTRTKAFEIIMKKLWNAIAITFNGYKFNRKLAWAVINYLREQAEGAEVMGFIVDVYVIGDMVDVNVEVVVN